MRHIIITRFLTSFIILTVLVSGLIPVSASEISSKTLGGLELKQSIEEEKDMIDYTISNAKISISNKEKQALDDNNNLYKLITSEDKKGRKKYAKYFAGSYINDDENLVVQLTQDVNVSEKNNIINNVSDSASVKIVEKSYENLLTQYNRISESMDRLSDSVKNNAATSLEASVSENLLGVSIDQKNNCIVITLKKVTDNTKKRFIEVFEEKDVQFKESSQKSIINEKTSVKPGASFAIYKSSAYYYGRSVGPRLAYQKSDGSTIYGFLTAAHCVDEKGQIIYYKAGEKYIKYGKVSLYKCSGCADAAFVKQTNTTDFTTSRYTAYSNSSGSKTEKYKACQNCAYAGLGCDIVQGATVYKCGRTTYLTKGKIDTFPTSFDYDGVHFKNFIEATYNSQGGDSGGVVFTIHSSTANTYDVAGVHRGRYGDNAVFTCLETYDEFVMNKNNCGGFYQY